MLVGNHVHDPPFQRSFFKKVTFSRMKPTGIISDFREQHHFYDSLLPSAESLKNNHYCLWLVHGRKIQDPLFIYQISFSKLIDLKTVIRYMGVRDSNLVMQSSVYKRERPPVWLYLRIYPNRRNKQVEGSNVVHGRLPCVVLTQQFNTPAVCPCIWLLWHLCSQRWSIRLSSSDFSLHRPAFFYFNDCMIIFHHFK